MKYFLTITFLVVCLNLFAQQTTDGDIKDSLYNLQLKKPHFEIGGRLMSNEVYNGQQVDSFPQWGFHPLLSLIMGKGWSVNYVGNYWSKNEPAYALTSVGLQKDFTVGKKTEGSVAYNRWFVHDFTRKDRQEFTQNIELEASYELGNISVCFYSMFLWGSSFSSFYSPSLEFSKSLWVGHQKNTRYNIAATALTDVGNYNASIVPFSSLARGVLKRKRNNPSLPVIIAPSGFGLLNYEMQLEQELDIKNTSIVLDINHSIPSAKLKNINGSSLTYITIQVIQHLYFRKKNNINK